MAQDTAGLVSLIAELLMPRRLFTLTLVCLLSAVALLPGQATTQQTPPTGSQPQAGQRAGGAGGRGRGAMQVLTLTAPWASGAEIPLKFTQAGGDTSPALSWSDPPQGIGSFVLVVHDVSAPVAPGTDDVLHWLVWNIPAAARALPEGVPQGPELPDGSRQISVTGPNYRGPAAPASGPAHVYLFELYAIDGLVDVPAIGAPGATVPQIRAAVMAAMAGRVRAKGVTVGVSRDARPPSR